MYLLWYPRNPIEALYALPPSSFEIDTGPELVPAKSVSNLNPEASLPCLIDSKIGALSFAPAPYRVPLSVLIDLPPILK